MARLAEIALALLAAASLAQAQSPDRAGTPSPPTQDRSTPQKETESQNLGNSDPRLQNAPPPRSASAREGSVSSSKDTKVDMSAPPDDYAHPGAGLPETQEFRPYDPHRADKNIEVGDYYFKRKNYRAAESRYREALQFKPKDALATFRLAEALEKEGRPEQARGFYQEYLDILPRGPLAEQARKALDRLPARAGPSSRKGQIPPKPSGGDSRQ